MLVLSAALPVTAREVITIEASQNPTYMVTFEINRVKNDQQSTRAYEIYMDESATFKLGNHVENSQIDIIRSSSDSNRYMVEFTLSYYLGDRFIRRGAKKMSLMEGVRNKMGEDHQVRERDGLITEETREEWFTFKRY